MQGKRRTPFLPKETSSLDPELQVSRDGHQRKGQLHGRRRRHAKEISQRSSPTETPIR